MGTCRLRTGLDPQHGLAFQHSNYWLLVLVLNSPRDFGGSVTSCGNIAVKHSSLQLFEAHQKHNESKPEISCQHPPKGHEPTPTITVTAAPLSQYFHPRPTPLLTNLQWLCGGGAKHRQPWRSRSWSVLVGRGLLIYDLQLLEPILEAEKKSRNIMDLNGPEKVHQYENFGQQRFGSQQFTKLNSMPLWGGLCFINPHFSNKKFITIFVPAMLGHWRVSSIITETGWAEHLQNGKENMCAAQCFVRSPCKTGVQNVERSAPLFLISSFLLYPHPVGTHTSHGVMRLGMVEKNNLNSTKSCLKWLFSLQPKNAAADTPPPAPWWAHRWKATATCGVQPTMLPLPLPVVEYLLVYLCYANVWTCPRMNIQTAY